MKYTPRIRHARYCALIEKLLQEQSSLGFDAIRHLVSEECKGFFHAHDFEVAFDTFISHKKVEVVFNEHGNCIVNAL